MFVFYSCPGNALALFRRPIFDPASATPDSFRSPSVSTSRSRHDINALRGLDESDEERDSKSSGGAFSTLSNGLKAFSSTINPFNKLGNSSSPNSSNTGQQVNVSLGSNNTSHSGKISRAALSKDNRGRARNIQPRSRPSRDAQPGQIEGDEHATMIVNDASVGLELEGKKLSRADTDASAVFNLLYATFLLPMLANPSRSGLIATS